MLKNIVRVLPVLCLAGAALPAAAQSADGSGSITVIRPLTVTNDTPMAFGTVVRPATSAGNGTVAVAAAATPARSVTGDVVALASTSASAAKFTLDGEGGQTVSVTVPASFDMASGSDTLTVATSKDIGATVTLSGALGSDGTKVFYVGGSVPITNATASGAYAGTFTVSASYN